MSAADAFSPLFAVNDTAREPAVSEGITARARVAPSIDDLLVHQELVFRICLGYSRNYAEAEDLAQEVYLKAHQKLAGLREPSLAREWLLRIARNTCFDHQKKDRLRAVRLKLWAAETTAMPDLSGAGGDPDERVGQLKAAVRRLPGKLRDIFVLREYGHMSYGELASTMSLKKGTVMSRLNRARRKIAAALEEKKP